MISPFNKLFGKSEWTTRSILFESLGEQAEPGFFGVRFDYFWQRLQINRPNIDQLRLRSREHVMIQAG